MGNHGGRDRWYGPRTLPVDRAEDAMKFASRAEAMKEIENARTGFASRLCAEECTPSRPPPATRQLPPIHAEIKRLLVERGWGIDKGAQENASGEQREFIHPDSGKRMAWLDAVLADMERREAREREGR
jgi:hypothetical protein